MKVQIPQVAVTPISDADLKLHLRVDGSDEDDLINAINRAATERVQAEINRCLTSTELVGTMPEFPNTRYIDLPFPPIQEISEIEYIDANGDTQTLDPNTYELIDNKLCLHPDSNWWPVTQSNRLNAVTITYIAGYDDDEYGSYPYPILQAIKWIAAHMYENREGSVIGTIAADLPMSVKWALSPYKTRF